MLLAGIYSSLACHFALCQYFVVVRKQSIIHTGQGRIGDEGLHGSVDGRWKVVDVDVEEGGRQVAALIDALVPCEWLREGGAHQHPASGASHDCSEGQPHAP